MSKLHGRDNWRGKVPPLSSWVSPASTPLAKDPWVSGDTMSFRVLIDPGKMSWPPASDEGGSWSETASPCLQRLVPSTEVVMGQRDTCRGNSQRGCRPRHREGSVPLRVGLRKAFWRQWHRGWVRGQGGSARLRRRRMWGSRNDLHFIETREGSWRGQHRSVLKLKQSHDDWILAGRWWQQSSAFGGAGPGGGSSARDACAWGRVAVGSRKRDSSFASVTECPPVLGAPQWHCHLPSPHRPGKETRGSKKQKPLTCWTYGHQARTYRRGYRRGHRRGAPRLCLHQSSRGPSVRTKMLPLHPTRPLSTPAHVYSSSTLGKNLETQR